MITAARCRRLADRVAGFVELWAHLPYYRYVAYLIRALHLQRVLDRAYSYWRGGVCSAAVASKGAGFPVTDTWSRPRVLTALGVRSTAAVADKGARLFVRTLAVTLLSWPGGARLMADQKLTIDDRRSGDYAATLGGSWRMITDAVMGGVSTGTLSLASVDGRDCLRLQGEVRLENRGGFIQVALDISDTPAADASAYTGLRLEVYGNDQAYNLHLRTDDVWLPWQAYRASFNAPARWHTVRLPFSDFAGYRIGKRLDVRHLERIGVVAIGRAFRADLCIADVALYREER